MTFYCYFLYTDAGHTYIGATTDPDRRLDQHNQIKSGGARATGIRVAQGHTWKRACYLAGIPEWRSALQIEWKWKQLGRTSYKQIRNPIRRRLHSLHGLLQLEKPTSSSIPYEMYPDGPPVIHWESDDCKKWYEEIASCEFKQSES